jgi:His/Glu/Gln/Arg/opine family amino acid ABC transporter permease subunit
MPAWVPSVAAYMAHGLAVTAVLSAVGVAASIVLGTVLGVLQTARVAPVRGLVRLYVELWRGLPIVITLFFIFFALPAVRVNVSALTSAAVGLALWGSANAAEIVRGAILSIPRTQLDAAYALGLSWRQAMVHVILAQAVRRTIPPMMGLLTNLVQNTALAAVIGVPELLETAKRSIERLTVDTGNSHATAIFGGVLVVFFLVCFPLTHASRRLERRLL